MINTIPSSMTKAEASRRIDALKAQRGKVKHR